MTNTIQTRQGDPGKTPYQRAVELGLFTGTEAEYNASLQGEDGLPGPPGSPDTPQQVADKYHQVANEFTDADQATLSNALLRAGGTLTGDLDFDFSSITTLAQASGSGRTVQFEDGHLLGGWSTDGQPFSVGNGSATTHAVAIGQLGGAAFVSTGTAIGNVVELVDVGGNPGLPAVDGSALTNITAGASFDQDLNTTDNVDFNQVEVLKEFTSTTNFESLELKATPTGYQIGSTVGSAGGSNQPVSIGHTDAAGVFTAGLTVGTDLRTSVASGLNLAPITTAALLATTAAVDAGSYRVTDSTPPNQGVYPDGTNWRYYDNTIVS